MTGPLGADAHLSLGAQGCDGFDGGFAHDGACAGLAVDVLTYFAANLGVDSEYFCHCVLLFNCYTFCLFVLLACRHVHLPVSFERRGKSTGVGKNGIGLCQLPVVVGGALRVRSGWDCRDKREGAKGYKGGIRPDLGKIGVKGA